MLWVRPESPDSDKDIMGCEDPSIVLESFTKLSATNIPKLLETAVFLFSLLHQLGCFPHTFASSKREILFLKRYLSQASSGALPLGYQNSLPLAGLCVSSSLQLDL